MRFRWKLLILLLVIAMVPTVVLRLIGTRLVRNLGDAVVAESQETLVQNAEDRLRHTVDGYTSMLRMLREKVELALILQVEEVERALAGKPVDGPTIYYASDFVSKPNQIPDLQTSPLYLKKNRSGQTVAMKVSFSVQSFHLRVELVDGPVSFQHPQ